MKANVQLRQEVTREDARAILGWMQDGEVLRYLNEDQHIAQGLERALQSSGLPVLTPLFQSGGGGFFMVCTPQDQPCGFLRLVPRQQDVEMVVVVGDRQQWGKGLGSGAVQMGLQHAFFKWRSSRVIAKIHTHNQRSHHVFKRAGFVCEREMPPNSHYVLSMEDYLKRFAQK